MHASAHQVSPADLRIPQNQRLQTGLVSLSRVQPHSLPILEAYGPSTESFLSLDMLSLQCSVRPTCSFKLY